MATMNQTFNRTIIELKRDYNAVFLIEITDF